MSNVQNIKINKSDIKESSIKEVSFVNNLIFWVDLLPRGQNSNKSIFVRPFNKKNAIPQKLTSDDFNVKSNFHGYGGKSYKCLEFGEKLFLIWIDHYSKAIWFQIFRFKKIIDQAEDKYLVSDGNPRQLSESIEGAFDSSFVITGKNVLYGLCEINHIDYLFSLNLNETKQKINVIKKFDNFAGELSSNKDGNLLSWIEWNPPYMPWEKNDLFFAVIEEKGEIINIKRFSNQEINISKNVSFFQPYWLSENFLVCSEDSSGWWNLLFLDLSDIENIIIKKRIIKYAYEYGLPQWVSGISFFSGSIKNLFCLAKKENSWVLEQYKDFQYVKELHLPLTSISDLSAFGQKLALRGSGFGFLNYLFELDFAEENRDHFSNNIHFELVSEYVKPESFWFKGFNNKSTHSFLYRPLIQRFRKPPLILKAHSGPTANFDGSLNFEVQYWTAKGFFVAEVNYGGSSGFGRDYRDRLHHKWGILDSYDCQALVIDLIRLDLIDIDKIAIFGNSAGGLTALNALCDVDFFKVAICKYPVLDLHEMYHNTHRFEKHYLNFLIGDYSKLNHEYFIRSPIHKITKTKKPILLFHGKKDLVISYKQTLKIKETLIQNNEYSEVILFENEGHGFQNIENKQKVLNITYEFLKKTLKI